MASTSTAVREMGVRGDSVYILGAGLRGKGDGLEVLLYAILQCLMYRNVGVLFSSDSGICEWCKQKILQFQAFSLGNNANLIMC